jgi:hypothetical protein
VLTDAIAELLVADAGRTLPRLTANDGASLALVDIVVRRECGLVGRGKRG